MGLLYIYVIQICCLAAKRCSLPLEREREGVGGREREKTKTTKTVFYKDERRRENSKITHYFTRIVAEREREREG